MLASLFIEQQLYRNLEFFHTLFYLSDFKVAHHVYSELGSSSMEF